MTVTHRHQVGHRAITCTGFYVIVQHFLVLLIVKHLMNNLFAVINLYYIISAFLFKEFLYPTAMFLNNILNGV